MAPQADLRKTRDTRRFGQALNRSRIMAEGTENTVPYLMEAVHSCARLGEIQVMKEVFGVNKAPTMK